MALDGVGVEALEPELDRGEGRGRAGDGDRAVGRRPGCAASSRVEDGADVVD